MALNAFKRFPDQAQSIPQSPLDVMARGAIRVGAVIGEVALQAGTRLTTVDNTHRGIWPAERLQNFAVTAEELDHIDDLLSGI